MSSIMDVELRCSRCKKVSRLGDCEPCIAPDGSEGTGFGCPVKNCGGYMLEMKDSHDDVQSAANADN